jgi:hypothetical protein
MKNLYTLILILFSLTLPAQSEGDTIIIETFNYTQTHGSGIRDTMIDFPDDPDLSYHKIIMLYNMRCKDGLISTTSDRNKGCGEWDYSCNTYIHDSSRVDSVLSYTADHYISGFSGSTFSYVETPLFNYQQYRQKDVQLDGTNDETLYTLGENDFGIDHVVATDQHSGKSQYLYLEDELTAAGLTAGDIDAILLTANNTNVAEAAYLKVRLKQTDKSTLSASDPDLDGFTEVYLRDHDVSNGSNRIQFHTSFSWDGTSNLIVEFSFTNNQVSNPSEIQGHDPGYVSGIYAANGFSLESVNGKIDLPADPMSTISEEITISFWSNGNAEIQPAHNSIFHAVDDHNRRQVNLHLPWGNGSIYWDCGNDGSGYDRINKAANPDEYEGNWSHWAVTKNATTGDMKIYLNGALWHSGTDKTRLIDIYDFILGTSGNLNRSYFGKMDEVRVWDTELTEQDIHDWMHRSVDANHPYYSNLVAYYKLDEGNGTVVNDHSGFGESANIEGHMYWVYQRGDLLNKGFQETQERPLLVFAQGDYDLTITDVIVTDSVAIIPNIVHEYEIIPRYGTMLHDSINEVSVNEYWASRYVYTYDPEGMKIDSTLIMATGEIEIGELEYFNRYPMKFEIMSFVTPYGIWLDLGMEGKTWAFDVTDYAPILKGKKRMTIERGGQWQEDMDIRFAYIVGTPPRDVLDVQQIWRPDSKGYTAIMEDRAFEPRDVPLLEDGEYFKLRTVITGHGQQGEFIGRYHFLEIDGSQEFNWRIWTECSTNPVYPQGGTWIYDRAGWCPGQASDLAENDITHLVQAGETTNIDYGLQVASGTSNYIVNNQLVTYGGNNFDLDASIVRVIRPNSTDALNDRFNPACTYPEIVIQNTGSSTLYTVDIEYREVGGEPETHKWTGTLEFMDTAHVVLPINDVTFWTATSNLFEVTISNPNNEADEYAYNNTMITPFEGADVYEDGQTYIVELKTNNRGYENRLYLFDAEGNIVKAWEELDNNETYTFPITLDPGCYKLYINDNKDDGLYWWHNSTQGTGHLKLKDMGGTTLYTFEPEFGRFAEYEFGIGAITNIPEKRDVNFVNVYPNPANREIHVDLLGMKDKQVSISITTTTMVTVYEETRFIASDETGFDIQIENLPSGIYLVIVENEDNTYVKKVIRK